MSLGKINFSKIASVVLSLLIFGYLALITTNTPESIQKITFKNFDNKDKSVVLTDDWIDFFDVDKKNSKYKQKTISLLDKVFYLDSEDSKLTFEQNKENVDITVWKGLYYFNFWDLNKGHIIKNQYFSIDVLSSGKFFLDTRNTNSYIITSFDSVLNTKLLLRGVKMTDVSIYPHMSLVFKTRNNRSLKNADMLWVDTVNSIKYIQEPLLQIVEKPDFEWLSDDLKKDLILKKALYKFGYRDRNYAQKDKEGEDFLNLIKNLNIYDLDYAKKESDYLSSLEISNLTAVELINKYFNFFQNKQKKVVYYKNIVLKEINNLYQKSVGYNKASVNELYRDLLTLKEMSQEDYEELVKIIDWYYEIISINSNVENSYKKRNFSLLLSKINKVSVNSLEKDLYLSSVYSSFDVWSIEDYELTSYLNNYFVSYFLNSKWGFVDWISWSDFKALSFYFGKIIKTKLDLDKEGIKSNIEIIKNYTKINERLIEVVLKEIEKTNKFKVLNKIQKKKELTEKKNKLVKNFVFEYVDIFNAIVTSIDENYFIKDENGNSKLWEYNELTRAILTPSQEDSIKTLYGLLLKWDSSLHNYISKNNSLFWENKKKILYKKKRGEAEDYFLALTNYDRYLTIKKNAELEREWTLKDKIEDDTLTLEKLKVYLSEFEGIDYSDSDLEVIWSGDYFTSRYKIKLKTVWKNVSFDLIPSLRNKIENVIIDWESSPKFFELDVIKDKWGENIKVAWSEDKDKFLFKKFFVNTFSEKLIVSNLSNKGSENKKIDPIDARLIGDKLLNRESGDFRKIDLRKYRFSVKTIDVEDGIFVINDTEYTWNYKFTGSNRPIKWTLSGKYYLVNWIHEFQNIKLKFYKRDWDYFLDEYDFDNLGLNIKWNIKAFDFEKEIQKALDSYNNLSSIYFAINSKVKEISNIFYDLQYDTLNLEVINDNWIKFEITVDSKNNITRVLKNWKSISSWNMSLDKINTINFN